MKIKLLTLLFLCTTSLNAIANIDTSDRPTIKENDNCGLTENGTQYFEYSHPNTPNCLRKSSSWGWHRDEDLQNELYSANCENNTFVSRDINNTYDTPFNMNHIWCTSSVRSGIFIPTLSNTHDTDLDAEVACELFRTSNGNSALASYSPELNKCTYVGLSQTPCEPPFEDNPDNAICSLQMIIGDEIPDDTSGTDTAIVDDTPGTDTTVIDDTSGTNTSTIDDNDGDDGFTDVDEDDYFYPDGTDTSTVDGDGGNGDGGNTSNNDTDTTPEDEFDDDTETPTDDTGATNPDTGTGDTNGGTSNLLTLPTNFYTAINNNTNALSNLTNAVNTNNQILNSTPSIPNDVTPDEYTNLDTSGIDEAITYLGNLIADDPNAEEEFDYSYDLATLTELGDYNGGSYGTDGNFAGTGGSCPFATFTIPTTSITLDTSFVCTAMRPILNFFMSIVVIGLLIWGFRFILVS